MQLVDPEEGWYLPAAQFAQSLASEDPVMAEAVPSAQEKHAVDSKSSV